jgi:hypothetical protein
MGTEYWSPLVDFMRGRLIADGTIDADDLNLLRLTDSIDEASSIIAAFGMDKVRQTAAQRPSPQPLLGERPAPKTAPAHAP